MRSVCIPTFCGAWLAALITCAAAAQTESSHAPLILPDNKAVDMTVDTSSSPAAEPESAEPAPADSRPLGPAPAPPTTKIEKPPPPSPVGGIVWPEIGRLGTALGVVLGLLLIMRSVVRRVGGPLAGGSRPSGVLDVLARYPVARGQQLMLMKVGGRVVLVHQTKTAMTTLSEMSDPDEVAALLARIEAGSRSSTRFHGLLHRFISRAPAEPEVFPPAPVVDRKVVVDLTRRPPRGGRRKWRKEPAA